MRLVYREGGDAGEALLDRIEWARADIAIDDTDWA